jgi:hypothetical protein
LPRAAFAFAWPALAVAWPVFFAFAFVPLPLFAALALLVAAAPCGVARDVFVPLA